MTKQLSDLTKSLEDLTPDELRERIRTLREDRVVFTAGPKTKVKKQKQKKTAVDLLMDLPEEERKQIIAELLAGDED